MADLIFQGVASDTNRNARIWQRPMRSATSHARVCLFVAESPILAKTIAQEIGRIAARDIPFAKVLEQIQAVANHISDPDIGFFIAEAQGDTLLFHAHGPLDCFLAEPQENGLFMVTPLPVDIYTPNEPFSYVTGQVGNGIFIACTRTTTAITTPDTIAQAAHGDDGLWQLKQTLENEAAETGFCMVIGKSGDGASRTPPGARTPEAIDVIIPPATEVPITVAPETTFALFAEDGAVHQAVDEVQSWAKDTKAQFTASMQNASTFDPRSFFRRLGNAFWNGRSKGLTAEDGSESEKNASSTFHNFWHNAKSRFTALPKNVQFASAGLTLCIILFAIGLAIAPLFGYGRVNAALDRELVAVSSLVDDAQSNIIYKNEGHASSLLIEAEKRLAALTAEKPLIKNKDLARREGELASRISTMRTDLRHVVAIDPMERILIADAPSITTLTSMDKELYAARGNELLHWNSTQKRFENIVSTQNPIIAMSVDAVDHALLLHLQDGTLATMLPKTKKLTAGPTIPATIPVVTVYGGRLYGLEATRGIVRITDKAVTPWLKSPATIPESRAIVVDGDVYVAVANSIKKYRTGANANLVLAPMDPPLTDVKTISTTAESSYLYVLDRRGARLVAINKNGKLAKQYELPPETFAQSVAVDEQTKTAYLLIGATIVSVPLIHL